MVTGNNNFEHRQDLRVIKPSSIALSKDIVLDFVVSVNFWINLGYIKKSVMEDFDRLPIYRKGEIVFKKARYVSCISYYQHTVVLYELNGQHFEVFYSPYEDKINDICKAKKERLHLYCPQVDEME